MRKIIVTIFLLSILGSTVCQAAGAVMINHVMAEKIDCINGKGCFVTGPISVVFELSAGATASNLKFTTLDQIMFLVGTYNVEQKIIEDVTGKVVTSAKHKSSTVKNNQEFRHLTVDWKFAAKMGMYTYQVVVNDEMIATYKIRVVGAREYSAKQLQR